MASGHGTFIGGDTTNDIVSLNTGPYALLQNSFLNNEMWIADEGHPNCPYICTARTSAGSKSATERCAARHKDRSGAMVEQRVQGTEYIEIIARLPALTDP